jgi:hypothetical protein
MHHCWAKLSVAIDDFDCDDSMWHMHVTVKSEWHFWISKRAVCNGYISMKHEDASNARVLVQ